MPEGEMRQIWQHDGVEVLVESTGRFSFQFNWWVRTGNGSMYKRGRNYRHARSLAIVIQRYGEDALYDDKNIVPVEVALDGTKAIAVYLLGVHRMQRRDVADRIGIAPETVTKYLTRMDPLKHS